MINRWRYPYFIAGIFILCFLNTSYSQKDTVTILLNGEFKKRDKFLLRYEKDAIMTFGYENQYDSIQIIIDSVQEEFQSLNIQILRKKWFGFDSVKRLLIYDPDRKYIHLYHPRIKEREYFEVYYLNTKNSLYLFHCTG